MANDFLDSALQIPLENLLLDVENPRLVSINYEKTQGGLVKALYSEMAIDEVALSIAANGYFQQEPLFVIREKIGSKATGKYIVVEGNRRLAAVKLLSDPALRKRLKASDIPEITKDAVAKLKSLPAIEYSDKKAIWQYLGFRHINGIKEWDSYSKAFYVAEVHEKFQIPLTDIASKIGDKHATVKRLYRGYTVLRQAEKFGFDKSNHFKNRFFFSHLYTALDQPDFQKFLGLESESSLKSDPVPRSKKSMTLELMTWLYGNKTDGIAPVVVKQNPDLSKLREVIASPSALAALRSGTSLQMSHDISIGDRRRFEDGIYRAEEYLKQALSVSLKGFDKNNEVMRQTITGLIELVEELAERTIDRETRRRSTRQ